MKEESSLSPVLSPDLEDPEFLFWNPFGKPALSTQCTFFSDPGFDPLCPLGHVS